MNVDGKTKIQNYEAIGKKFYTDEDYKSIVSEYFPTYPHLLTNYNACTVEIKHTIDTFKYCERLYEHLSTLPNVSFHFNSKIDSFTFG